MAITRKSTTGITDDAIDRIKDLKEEVEEAKRKKANLEGQLEVVKKNLKDEFGVKNLKEAVTKRESLQKRVDTLGEKIGTLLSNIEDKLETMERSGDD